MDKDTYLDNAQPFIKWMSENLYNNTFSHSYINRMNNREVSFTSLYDAFEKYQWSHSGIPRLGVARGNTFATNAEALSALRKDLRRSIAEDSDESACRAAVDVMRWGGVVNGNEDWLNKNKNGLVELLIDIRDVLNSIDTNHASLNDRNLRFNAGMTKVYSLICDDFIIYDSRVAAALGLSVVKYVESDNDIVLGLGFPWSSAKEALNAQSPKNRNPGNDVLIFPRLKNGPMHAKWNLKASWVLKAVIDLDRCSMGKFSQLDDPLRAMESALFMIGYDIPVLPNVISHAS